MPAEPLPVVVAREPFDSPDASALRAAQRVELDARYGRDDHEPGAKPTADSVPVFLVARDAGGVALGCGGLRMLGGGDEGDPLAVRDPLAGRDTLADRDPLAVRDTLADRDLHAVSEPLAEIKRMYVSPAARGRGVSTAILRAIEQEARALGIRRLLLETGTEQPDAMRFYEREGYARIPNFGAYIGSPISVCYGRDLSEPS